MVKETATDTTDRMHMLVLQAPVEGAVEEGRAAKERRAAKEAKAATAAEAAGMRAAELVAVRVAQSEATRWTRSARPWHSSLVAI